MRRLGLFVFILSMLLCSCNNNNEPDLVIELPINSVYVPVSIEINKADLDEQERKELLNLANNKHIVNDVSEVPNDPIGKNQAFYNVNYNENTLLIMYIFKTWPIETYSNLFYRNTEDNSYNWLVKLGTFLGYDEDSEAIQFTRLAILVRKLPAEADVQTWYSITQLGLQAY